MLHTFSPECSTIQVHWRERKRAREREREGHHFAICSTYVFHGHRFVHVADLLGEISNVAQIWWRKWLKSSINLIGVTSNCSAAEKHFRPPFESIEVSQTTRSHHKNPSLHKNTSEIVFNLFPSVSVPEVVRSIKEWDRWHTFELHEIYDDKQWEFRKQINRLIYLPTPELFPVFIHFLQTCQMFLYFSGYNIVNKHESPKWMFNISIVSQRSCWAIK